jgi:hypothetical protein
MVDLIHLRTRNAFRETCSDFAVVRQICQAFENEGFDAATDESPPRGWYGPGQRRGTFDRYTCRVDWTDPRQVRRILNVFEEILGWLDNNDEHSARRRNELYGHLTRDGFQVDANGHIRTSVLAAVAELDLSGLREPAAIMEHLERIAGVMDTDPSLAISEAKALVEATAKIALDELQEIYDDRADVPALVKAAQKALQLHPELLAPTVKGVESIKRVLSALSQIAVSLAELRNEYGTDHGRSRPTTGLGPRHAHLAVGAATTYCRMLLETLATRRSRSSAPASTATTGRLR